MVGSRRVIDGGLAGAPSLSSRLLVALVLAAAAARRQLGRTASTPTKPDRARLARSTTIFVIALGIPLMLTILTLIDIARGKHTEQHDH